MNKILAPVLVLFASSIASVVAQTPGEPASRVAQPFALGDVQLLDSRFRQNMERNADYLLFLEPDRFLHNTRQYCGLEPKGALYGGWESRGVAGQSLGHYLTAISQQFAATSDKRFRERIDYIITEMAECQKRYGDGYIGALPPLELATLRGFKEGKVEMQGGFGFVGGAWVPWYTQHKILAGLKDAWILGGNQQAKDVAIKLCDWIDSITAPLTTAQQQAMLGVEFGGMPEVLIEMSYRTGNPRYLEVSKRFYQHAVLDPLLAGRDELPGKHANTQIPKIVGEARRYEVTTNTDSRKIAEYFWDRVVNHHSFVLGGNSDREHFFPENAAADHLSPETAESCNTYNMLRLTTHLFSWQPQVAYGDFYERALYNQILPSQEPRHSMFTYFVSLKPGHYRTYSDPTNSFWCCVGSGMENHTKYGEAIYFHTADELYVNLFIPSELTWKEKGLILDMTTDYPEGETVNFRLRTKPTGPFKLKIRVPSWATGPASATLDGHVLITDGKPGTFLEIQGLWEKDNRVRVTIPMGLRTEALAGAPNKVAFLYGPLVLAGDLGPVPESKTFPNAGDHTVNERARTADVPALVCESPAAALKSLKRVPGDELVFQFDTIAKPKPVTLRAFNSLPYNYYNVYWDILTPAAWTTKQAALAAAAEAKKADEARTVDELRPGEQQSEVDHALTSQTSNTGDFAGGKWRDAMNGGHFAFRMKVVPNVAQVLRCTYWGDDANNRVFDIQVDGKTIATQTLERNKPGQFFDVEYAIPAELVANRDTITVRFQAQPGKTAGGLFSCLVMKAK